MAGGDGDVSVTWMDIAGFHTAVIALHSRRSALNVWDDDMYVALKEAIDKVAEKAEECQGMIVCSRHKQAFMAGADIRMQLQLMDHPEELEEKITLLNDLCNRIEGLPFPTLAVLNGATLGGGLELALAMRHRVADATCKSIGLPEVKLGVVPGAGGVARLPRLVGLTEGLTMMLSGAAVSAAHALESGLVDALLPSTNWPLTGSTSNEPGWLPSLTEAWRSGRLRDTGPKWPSTVFQFGRSWSEQQMVYSSSLRTLDAKTRRKLPAPYICLDAVLEAWNCPSMRDAINVGARSYVTAASTPEARALMNLFLATRDAKKRSDPGQPDPDPDTDTDGGDAGGSGASSSGGTANTNSGSGSTPTSPSSASSLAGPMVVTVIGAGYMGAGIAQAMLHRGLSVMLCDVDEEALDRARRRIRRLFQPLIQKRQLTEMQVQARMSCLSLSTVVKIPYTPGISSVVLECVTERLDIKTELIRQVESIPVPKGCKPAVFLSNTSSIPIATLAAASSRPHLVAGLHFFDPERNNTPIVEIIRGAGGSERAVRLAVALASMLGKTPVTVADRPGFAMNRMSGAWYAEAVNIAVEGGASITRIDTAMQEVGFPAGPFTILDRIGLATALHVSEFLKPHIDQRGAGKHVEALLHLLRLMTSRGLTGKTPDGDGTGFYCWAKGKAQKVNPDVKSLLQLTRSQLAAQHDEQQKTGPGVAAAAAAEAEARGEADADADAHLLSTKRLPMLSKGDVCSALGAVLLNEACACLEENVATAQDLDLVMVLGLGFPPGMGGPLYSADCCSSHGSQADDMNRIADLTGHWWLRPHARLLITPQRAFHPGVPPSARTAVRPRKWLPFFLDSRTVMVSAAIIAAIAARFWWFA